MTSAPLLSAGLRRRLEDDGVDADDVAAVIRRALDEDITDRGDVTSLACIEETQCSAASFVARGSGCLAGMHVVAAVIETVCGANEIELEVLVDDGGILEAGTIIARVEASTRSLLVVERTALNLLCHLSGIASTTAQWVRAVAGTGAVIRDTRKTTPGLRALEKYAVRCGGGMNHRMNLSDAVLVKDNHIAAAGGVVATFSLVRAHVDDLSIEIEVDNLDQLDTAIEAGADLVLLDNFSVDDLRRAVETGRRHLSTTGRPVLFEASGGLTLATVRAVADTGVQFLAVGNLTHSSPILDIGLDFLDPH